MQHFHSFELSLTSLHHAGDLDMCLSTGQDHFVAAHENILGSL